MERKPKLALIPSAYKAGKVYSVLPADGVGDFDFSRSGQATRVNKDGLIETVGSNVPRLNYPMIDGVVSGCPSLLLEPERRNLITHSEDFSDASWEKFNTTITPNSVISPDGSQTASTIESTDASHLLYSTVSVTSETLYTFSYFFKSGTKDASSVKVAFYDDTSKAFINTDADKKIVEYPNGWQRIIVNVTTPVGCVSLVSYIDRSSGIGTFYVWGAQVEQGSYATSYIPTNGGTVTRSAETCNGAGDANTFNDSEGVLMFDGFIPNDGNEKIIQLSNNTSNEGVIRIFPRANGTNIRFQITSGGTSSVNQELPLPSDNFYKIAIKYKTNDVSFWANGLEIYSGLIATIPSGLNELLFGSDIGNPFYGNIKQIQYFDSALTDTELEGLTSWKSFNEMAQAQLYTIQ